MLQSTKIDADNVQLIMVMLRNITDASLDAVTDKDKVRILAQKVEFEQALSLGHKDDDESSDADMAEEHPLLSAED